MVTSREPGQLSREEYLSHLWHQWILDGVSELIFYPLIPGLPMDAHQLASFEQYLGVGNGFEAVVRIYGLEEMFMSVDSYCDRVSSDYSGTERAKGKRLIVNKRPYIYPDFRVKHARGDRYLIDLKSKQYHGYFHQAREVQQVVDKNVLDDYLVIGHDENVPVFILFHLWPSAWMKAFGKADTARIHAGPPHDPRFFLPDEKRQELLKSFPVNDYYYLMLASDIKRHGQIRPVRKNEPGYFFNLKLAVKGPKQGELPPIGAWRHLIQVSCREEPTP